MWRSKKLIIAVAAAVVLLVGSVGGVALAQTGGATTSSAGKTLMARVATILGVDQQKLESAFAQARREMQVEALDKYLKDLVAQGKMTQAQADQYKQWWLSRPDIEPYRQQIEKWQQARPDVPVPGRMGKAFPGGMRGGMKGW